MPTQTELLSQEGDRQQAAALDLLDRVSRMAGANQGCVNQARNAVQAAYQWAQAALGLGPLAAAAAVHVDPGTPPTSDPVAPTTDPAPAPVIDHVGP